MLNSSQFKQTDLANLRGQGFKCWLWVPLLAVFISNAQAKVDFGIDFVELNLGYDANFSAKSGYKAESNKGIIFDITINENYHVQPSVFYSELNGITFNGNLLYDYTVVRFFHLQPSIGFITKNSFGYQSNNSQPSDDLYLHYFKFPLSLLLTFEDYFEFRVNPYFALLLNYDYNNYYDYSWIEDMDIFDYGIDFDLKLTNIIYKIYFGIFLDLGLAESNYNIKRQSFNTYYYEDGYFKNLAIGFNMGVDL